MLYLSLLLPRHELQSTREASLCRLVRPGRTYRASSLTLS